MHIRHLRRSRALIVLILGLASVLTSRASAHPMGNFSINHYTRLTLEPERISCRYILDLAEIPTVAEMGRWDANRNGALEDAEKQALLAASVPDLMSKLELRVGGRRVSTTTVSSDITLAQGAGGLQTMKVRIEFTAPFQHTGDATLVEFEDGNYAQRTGWREIVAKPQRSVVLVDSSVPMSDKSRELTAYPADVTPPQFRSAKLLVALDSSASRAATIAEPNAPSVPAAPKSTPGDAFTDSIAHRQLTPGLMAAGLLIAFVFGAFHALSPGHGKAMVAAYLVGARGTARHAALLGIIVTVTHTLGVFALGIATLCLSQYVVPEKLYPILSTISGLAVIGVGLTLLWRYSHGAPDHAHHHHHDHDHDHGGHHHHDHSHTHDHHDHHHDENGHVHYHDEHEHTHEPHHGHGHHHHVPEGPITLRSLLALGISGGIVPCPSALVVLLSAVAMHRIAYGLGLITAFSFGLAAVLVTIGLLVVWAREWLDRLPSAGSAMRRLPVASAAVITLVGTVLLVKAWS